MGGGIRVDCPGDLFAGFDCRDLLANSICHVLANVVVGRDAVPVGLDLVETGVGATIETTKTPRLSSIDGEGTVDIGDTRRPAWSHRFWAVILLFNEGTSSARNERHIGTLGL
jgi:hypothetical protein